MTCLFDGVVKGDEYLDLKEKAYKALNLSNDIGGSKVDDFSAYADLLMKEGKTDEAIKYLDRGLKLYPNQLEYQILYAKLLIGNGDEKLGKEKADFVYKTAETDELVYEAGQILGKEATADFPSISKLPGSDYCVVLVPMQGCAKWLISRMRDELSETLGIPVYVQTIDVVYPEASRSAYSRAIVQLRAKIKAQLSNPLALMLMEQYGYKEEDFESDEKLIRIAQKTLAMQNPDASKKLVDDIERLKLQEMQWDARILKAVLFNSVKSYRRAGVVYLGITPADILADGKAFVLGSADSFGGVISYHRFTADFANDFPKQDRLFKRTKMQCLVSLGDAWGVDSCLNSTCARAYPKSLAQHDAKSGELCDQCSSAFKKVFGDKAGKTNQPEK